MKLLPSLITWNLTYRCNLRCGHCYAGASPQGGAELSSEEAHQVVDQIASLAPGAMLVLSGGRPLARPDLPEIAGRAARRGLTVVLGTNGMLLTRELGPFPSL